MEATVIKTKLSALAPDFLIGLSLLGIFLQKSIKSISLGRYNPMERPIEYLFFYLFLILFFGTIFYAPIKCLLRKRKYLVIDEKGLHFFNWRREYFVPWGDINYFHNTEYNYDHNLIKKRRIHAVDLFANKKLNIPLVEWKRRGRRIYHIETNKLEVSPCELISAMSTHYLKYIEQHSEIPY